VKQGQNQEIDRGHGFGTAPVFLASISTILGAVLFLRFGYAVGHVGLAGTVLIVVLGHMVTIPTALAIAEIATNRRVEGAGEYFIISRSFGAITDGRLPISRKNLRVIPTDARVDFDKLVESRSADADLVLFGFTEERVRTKGIELFRRHPSLRDVLFVAAEQRILIE